MAELRVRPAEDADLAVAARLRWDWIAGARGEAPPSEREGFEAAFVGWARSHRGTHRCYVVADGGVVIGAGWLARSIRVPSPSRFDRLNCDVQSVVVDPEHRGRGAGALLVERLVAEARAMGAERIVVHSSADGVGLYDRAGFSSSELLRDIDLTVDPPGPRDRAAEI